jgi:hypothetical protein
MALAAFRGVAGAPETFTAALQVGDEHSAVECAVDAG